MINEPNEPTIKPVRVLAVSPYEGLREVIDAAAKDMPHLVITHVTGDLGEGVGAARKVIGEGFFDVIISRGGTADLLAAEFSLPVVNIDVSGYDFVRVIKLAQSHSGKAAIVGFNKITGGASVICELLKSNIEIHTVSRESEVDETIARLQAAGYGIIIGDFVTVKATRRRGMNAILITSGRESVQKALEEGWRICRYLEDSRSRFSIVSAALKALEDKCIIYDGAGRLIYSSADGPDEEELISACASAAKELDYTGLVRRILRTNGGAWRLCGRPLGGGAGVVFSLSRLSPDVAREPPGIHMRSGGGDTQNPFSIFAAADEPMHSTVERARALAPGGAPIYIWGADGTGKGALSYAIHKSGPPSSELFLTVDCPLVTSEGWRLLLGSEKSILSENPPGTLYLRNVDALPRRAARNIAALMDEAGRVSGWRLISSSGRPPSAAMDCAQDRELARRMFAFSLYLPRLCERRGAIADIASLMIAEANVRYGREVVALEEDSLELLRGFSWEYDIDQLREVISELVMAAPSPYITSGEVKEALDRRDFAGEPRDFALPRDKTLLELEVDIIKRVIAEEGNNQSRAARRLGISRSTMWRKIKEYS